MLTHAPKGKIVRSRRCQRGGRGVTFALSLESKQGNIKRPPSR